MKSESVKRLEDVDRLRAAEKFMTVGTGEAECIQCGYLYKPKDGDPEYPVAPKTQFQVHSGSCALDPGSQRGGSTQQRVG